MFEVKVVYICKELDDAYLDVKRGRYSKEQQSAKGIGWFGKFKEICSYI